MKPIPFLALTILVITSCGNQPKKASDQVKEPIIPQLKVQVHGKSGLDTLPIQIFYLLPHQADHNNNWDTLKLNSEGYGEFNHVMGSWAGQYGIDIGDIFFGTFYLDNGLDLDIYLDSISIPEEEINFDIPNGFVFSGADGVPTRVLNAYSASEHPIKDSLKELFKHIRSKKDSTTKQRIESIDNYSNLLNIYILDSFQYDDQPKFNQWLCGKKYMSRAGWFCLSLGSDVDWFNNFTKNQMPEFTGFGTSEWQFYKYFWYGFNYSIRTEIEAKLLELVDSAKAKGSDSVFLALSKMASPNEKELDKAYYQAVKDHKRDLIPFVTKQYVEEASQHDEHRDFMLTTGGPSDAYDRYLYLKLAIPKVQDAFLKALLEEQFAELQIIATRIEKADAEGLQSKQTALGVLEAEYDFGANMYQANHADFESLLAALQDSFKGKALILDVWATWCSPCKRDMKASGSVKKQLEELPVEVVYLCTNRGSNPNIWKEIVLEYETSGTHIWLGEDLTKKLIEHYSLKYYPSYYFYDKDRNFDEDYIHHIAEIDVVDLAKKLEKAAAN